MNQDRKGGSRPQGDHAMEYFVFFAEHSPLDWGEGGGGQDKDAQKEAGARYLRVGVRCLWSHNRQINS